MIGTVKEIRSQIATVLYNQIPKENRIDPKLQEKLVETATKMTGFLSCQLYGNQKMSPIFCMTCPYGHMTECHYPLTCEEAHCSHYLRECEMEVESDDYAET